MDSYIYYSHTLLEFVSLFILFEGKLRNTSIIDIVIVEFISYIYLQCNEK